jgi:hypothetical protein
VANLGQANVCRATKESQVSAYFNIDESASIGPFNFDSVKDYVSNLIADLESGTDASEFALV